jgi:phage repressor protein C with HTH and peptisase S24 domain
MIFFRKVVGDSMRPTLKHGQIVWAHELRSYREGQVVIAFVRGKEVIKRIEKIEKGKIFLIGDNKERSNDSRDYGSIPDTNIKGIVFWPKTKLQ